MLIIKRIGICIACGAPILLLCLGFDWILRILFFLFSYVYFRIAACCLFKLTFGFSFFWRWANLKWVCAKIAKFSISRLPTCLSIYLGIVGIMSVHIYLPKAVLLRWKDIQSSRTNSPELCRYICTGIVLLHSD